MNNKIQLGKLMIDYHNRDRKNDIIIDTENNEITFKNFLKYDLNEETIVFKEQELEAAILTNSGIKLGEISEIFHVTHAELEQIFKSLRQKIVAPNYCTKKYISSRLCEIFPNKICYAILNKYNLTKIAIERGGIFPENSYNQSLYEKRKENVKYKNIYKPYVEMQIQILAYILDLLSLEISHDKLLELVKNILIKE